MLPLRRKATAGALFCCVATRADGLKCLQHLWKNINKWSVWVMER